MYMYTESLATCMHDCVCSQQAKESSQSKELVTGISAVAILEIRQAKAEFLEVWRREEGDEGTAEHTLAKLAFLDFEQDEYAMEVAEEMMHLLREMAVRCKAPTTTLEIIRALKSMAESFNSQWEAAQVKDVCQLVLTAIRGNHNRRSKSYQSALAFLKDLSSYKPLKEVSKEPLKALKSLRTAKDETDTGEPPSKRPHTEEEEEMEDQYHELMEQLADCTDPEQALNLEREIESLGCDVHVQ